MLLVVLPLLYATALGSKYVFRISNSRQDFAALNTVYEPVHDTWLSPSVYLKHDKLPSFRNYWSSRVKSAGDDLQFEQDIERFIAAFSDKLEAFRERVIGLLIENKQQPTFASVSKIITEFRSLQLQIADQFSSDYSLEYENFFSTIKSFICPDIRFWITGSDLDKSPPISLVAFDEETPLYEYYRFLKNHQEKLGEKLAGKWTVQNPFGMGQQYKVVIRNEINADYSDKEVVVGDLLAEACKLDLTNKFDENIHKLVAIDEKLWNLNYYVPTLIFILISEASSDSNSSTAELTLVNRREVPVKFINGRLCNSALQLRAELSRPAQYGPLTTTPSLTENVQYPHGFSEAILAHLAPFVNDQPYNATPLVCKAFYKHLKGSVNEWAGFRYAVPQDGLKDFVQSAIYTEVYRSDSDSEQFARKLVEFIRKYGIIDKTLLYLDAPENVVVEKWVKVMWTLDRMVFEFNYKLFLSSMQ